MTPEMTALHPNERGIFPLGGKPYVWTRGVNGGEPLKALPARKPDGSLTPLALDRLADQK